MMYQNNDLKKTLIKSNNVTKKLKSDQEQQQQHQRIPSKNARDQKSTVFLIYGIKNQLIQI